MCKTHNIELRLLFAVVKLSIFFSIRMSFLRSIACTLKWKSAFRISNNENDQMWACNLIHRSIWATNYIRYVECCQMWWILNVVDSFNAHITKSNNRFNAYVSVWCMLKTLTSKYHWLWPLYAIFQPNFGSQWNWAIFFRCCWTLKKNFFLALRRWTSFV